MQKDVLRREMLDMRCGMPEDEVQALSALICERLLSLQHVKTAGCILTYYPIKNEPDIRLVTNKLLDMGKRLALPCVRGNNIIAAEYQRDTEFKRGAYGIPEPPETCAEVQPDAIIVPGVVFDEKLCRIGFGAGYYDRYLAGRSAVKIGVCFESQIVDEIEAAAHDIRMDFLVTEKRILGAA